MGTTLNLYYTYSSVYQDRWELIPSKLLVVEDIATYLGTKAKKSISDFQYIKNELEISINVDISQDYSQPRSATNFKYVSIQNPNEAIHYYFVKKATWRSKTCVRFELVLDVLNTFQEGRDYNFKANTRIVREHKDRFNSESIIAFTFETLIDSGDPFTNGEKIYIKDNNEENNQYEGTLISAVWNALLEVYIITIKFDEIITYDELSTWLSSVSYAGDEIIFYQDEERYNRVDPLDLINSMSESDVENKTYRNIDMVNEGVSPVLQCGSADGNKIENPTSLLQQNWYLLYRNQNDPDDTLTNPVNCYLIPEEATLTDAGYIQNGRIIPSWLEDGKFYYFRVVDNSGDSPVSYTLSNGVVISDTNSSHKTTLVISKATNNKISVQVVRAIYNSTTEVIGNYITDYITASPLPAKYNVDDTFWDTNYTNYYTNITFPSSFNNSGDLNNVDAITNLDKGDPKNIKLIKLPYCPYNFTLVGSALKISTDQYWEYASFEQQSGGTMYALKLIDMNLKLSASMLEESNNPLPSLLFSPDSPSITDLRRGEEYESKLFHSDFYQPTYVYDSFTYKVQLEKIDEEQYGYYTAQKIKIVFHMTSTINSRFMFEFDNLYFKYAIENYAKYMPIARNNEEVLYNVPYINYIRNGFNYDVKAKERTNVSNVIGMGLSLGSTAASLLLPSVSLKVAGVVAGLVSMAMSIKNTITSALQNEDSIRRKLQETANQTSSVAGSDDVDLMSVYAGNRLKYLVYEPTPLMKGILFDLFFYAGYSSGRIGLPNHNTRVNFDYLECEANLENEGSIPDDCLQELINCFKTGITYLHKTSRNTNKWDFEQQYENWEKSIVED